MRVLPVLLALASLPAPAWAAEATIAEREVPLAGERVLAASAPARFNLVGLHWRGSGAVELRTRARGGRWGPWLEVEAEGRDGPDPRSPEARGTQGWRLGDPVWVGASDQIAYRVRGDVRRLRAFFVWSPPASVPARTLAAAGLPEVVPRLSWAADESITRGPPRYADAVRFAVVHHTAGPNTYSRAEAPAVVKAIQLYHVKGNGWNDIGYNFLVDRFGTVYEGRSGGLDRNVVGAHALGFNTGSVGVAVLGSFEQAPPPPVAESALARLLAWRLDLAHVDPLSSLTVLSGGSERFPAGIPVLLRAISGHRDTGFTACPGDALFARLPAIAAAVARLGLPKLYEPEALSGEDGLVRFTARLSQALPWSVRVTDALGAEVATGRGSGAAVDWSWDPASVLPGSYRWRIEAGPQVTPATGELSAGAAPAALAIADLAISRATITPNGDGVDDEAAITFRTSTPARVAATVVDALGADAAALQLPVRKPAGEHTLTFTGAGLPDGRYTIRVDAHGTGEERVSATVSVRVTRTLAAVAVSPATVSPNGDGRGDRLTVRLRLGGPADVKVQIVREGVWVATPFSGRLRAGARVARWDGTKRLGRPADGAYTAVVEATDEVGTSRVELPFAYDASAPVVRVDRVRAPARLWVSEPASLTVRVNGSLRRLRAEARGRVELAGIERIRSLAVVARDAAGNRSALARRVGAR